MPHDEEEFEVAAATEGLVGRLLKRGVGAPTAAIGYLGEQFNGWKSEFMAIFQTEIRRFLDRVNPSEELEKLTVGKRLEITMSVKLVDDRSPKAPSSASGAKPKGKKKKSDGHR